MTNCLSVKSTVYYKQQISVVCPKSHFCHKGETGLIRDPCTFHLTMKQIAKVTLFINVTLSEITLPVGNAPPPPPPPPPLMKKCPLLAPPPLYAPPPKIEQIR